MRFMPALILFALATGPLAAAPYIRITPATAPLQIGETLDVTIEVSTDGGEARGGGIYLSIDPAVYEVVGGKAGITKSAASVFELSPAPTISGGRITIAFLKSDFALVAYTGPVAQFQVRVLGRNGSSALTLLAASTRFAPALPGTELFSADYFTAVSPLDIKSYLLGLSGAPPDQNGDGVIDIADLLAKL